MIGIVSPPFDPIEITEPKAYTTGKRVPFGELSKRYRKRWYIDTSVGRVFFRRLGQLDRDDANLAYYLDHPEFAQVEEDRAILAEFLDNGIPLDEPHREKLRNLNLAMIPLQKVHASKCILDIDEKGNEKPAFASMEDYDAFLSVLLPDEVDAIYAILRDMTSTTPITDESHTMLVLAKEYNVPLAEGLTLENMSAEMADALAENAIKVAKEHQKAASKVHDA